MSQPIKPSQWHTLPVGHGGPDVLELRRHGLDPAKVVDFSVCTNPFGPSPRVYEALAHVALDQYPDPEAHALRATLAQHHGIAAECILAGNGASELIWLAAQAWIRPGRRILVLGPTYGEYARAAALQGGLVHLYNAQAQKRFTVAPEEIAAELQRYQPELVFLCNPNNPTGTVRATEHIQSWILHHPKTIFIVDEAYQPFTAGLASLLSVQTDNLLVLRSMTKDYALAGLRIGYAVGPVHLIDAMARVRPPWSVNALAQAAAVAALHDEAHRKSTLQDLERARQKLVAGLEALGLDVWPSATHFFLVRVGDASSFGKALLSHGILVRNASSFGLPAFVRLATRQPRDNDRLLTVLEEASW